MAWNAAWHPLLATEFRWSASSIRSYPAHVTLKTTTLKHLLRTDVGHYNLECAMQDV